jgi:3-oxoacyl-[acyl-carrier protein] reductase
MQSLKDKVAVITGASRGIGEAIARHLADRQMRLVLCARDRSALRNLAARLELPKERLLLISGDLTKETTIRKVVEKPFEQFGRLDLLVNNAGVGVKGLLEQMTEKDFRQAFDLNVKTVMLIMARLIPRLRRQGHGHIINISSLAGKQGVPQLSVYAASKAALNVLSESAALEVRGDNIKISVLAPGSVDTAFGGRTPDAGQRRLTADDVAEAVAHLAGQHDNAWTSLTELRPLIVRT